MDYFSESGAWCILGGDMVERLRELPDASVDAVVTDPPYGLSFMDRAWDYSVPRAAAWAEVLRVLRPGAHLLAFAGTRTQHRMAVEIEDAGFEVRDLLAWVYGGGMPKSGDVAKEIDKLDAADERQARAFRCTAWLRSTGISSGRVDELTGTNMGGHYLAQRSQPAVPTREHLEALRPHLGQEVPDWVEVLVTERTVESANFRARKVVGTVLKQDTRLASFAAPVRAQGEECTVRREVAITRAHTAEAQKWEGWGTALKPAFEPVTLARKPFRGTVARNVIAHGTGALNVVGCRVETEGDEAARWPANLLHDGSDEAVEPFGPAARFFYCPKASKADRGAWNAHPTVKPTELMRYLVRLVTPPGGLVLDPYAGSGSTGKAALLEGFRFVGVELEDESAQTAARRLDKIDPLGVWSDG